MFYNSFIHDNARLDNIPHYGFCFPTCIFKECWSPGVRTTESVGTTGYKLYGNNTLKDSHNIYVCTWMFDSGCPEASQNIEALAIGRINEGWRSSPV